MRMKNAFLATAAAGLMATGLFAASPASAAPAPQARGELSGLATHEAQAPEGAETAAMYNVTAWGGRTPVRSHPRNTSTQVGSVIGPNTYRAVCWGHYQEITYRGYTNDVWIELQFGDGGPAAWVTAIALEGNYRAGLPSHAKCPW